jgi:uncharacterized protein (TIGR00369 family)
MKHRLPFPLHIPFVEKLGLELWAFGDGQAELRLHLDPAHLNHLQVAHGGVLMTMLDVAMAHAARSVHATADDVGPGVVTIDLKSSFMRPAKGRLRATGTLLHRTANLAFAEGSVFDDAGHRCAHATATFKYLRALPGRGRERKTLQTAAAPTDTTGAGE